jgi:hypothetical protein
MLLKREGYGRNFLVDANVIPSTMKLGTKPRGPMGLETATELGP